MKKKAEVEKEKKKKPVKAVSKLGSIGFCDRITVVSDAEHMGEKMPFYSTFVKEGEEEVPEVDEDGKKKKVGKKLFYPDKRPTWNRAPVWSYKKRDTTPNQYIKTKEEMHEDKMKTWFAEKKEIPMEDVRKTFYNVTHRGNIHFEYKKPTDFNDDEHTAYREWKTIAPNKHVGPQHYWKTLPYDKSHKKRKEELNQDDDKPKTYYLDRKLTDKRVYKPMKTHIF